jgi:hypothetical protein
LATYIEAEVSMGKKAKSTVESEIIQVEGLEARSNAGVIERR